MSNNGIEFQDTVTVQLEVGYKDEKGNVHTEVELRDITGYDEELISKPEIRQNIGKTITALLSSVALRIGDLTPKSVGSPSKWEKIFRGLTMGDRDKLLLELRKLTHGNEIELDMKCPSCNSKIKHIVEIDEDIEEKPLKVDPYKIPFELPKGIKNRDNQLCKKGALRLPNGIDQEQLDSIARKNPGAANTTLLAHTIVELEGFEGSINLSTLRSMSIRDRDYLIKLLGESTYGPRFDLTFTCPSCGEEVEAGVHPLNFL